jgi:rare lipoprotein A
MPTRARRIAVLLAACALAVPAAARADEPPPTGGTAVPAPVARMIATPHVLVGKVARFRGSFPAREAGRVVAIERFDPKSGVWTAVTTARIAADGSYVARWRADVAGRHRTRATVGQSRPRNVDGGAALFAALGPDEAAMTVYRPALASWYGPGFYGRTTGCGERMTPALLGVAHKRLPCGAQVALAYGGRSITVPVVDRGPFVKGRRWDLTAATALALGFTFTDRIGAVRVG